MKKLYLTIFGLILFLSFVYQAKAQPCASLTFTTTSTESRCTATGSISVTAAGGSGAYNYRAVGPVSTPFTSSSVITGLPPGYYQVTVRDVSNGCQVVKDSVRVTGSYQDPRFGLSKTNVTCLGNNGTITVINQQYGRAPFTYSLIAPSPTGVGTTNSTGIFTGLSAGEYFVQLRDSCGGIQVRRATIEAYNWWIDYYTVSRVGCDSADAVIYLQDNRGAVNTSGAAFAGFTYGVVRSAGDTSWYPSYSFRFFLGTQRFVTLIARDPCGVKKTVAWTLPSNKKPSVGSVATSNLACSTFTAAVTGQQNLTNPEYCIYNAADVLLSCNSTGSFAGLPYGSYCIKIKDLCYDTTIVRCFTRTQPVPAVNNSVSISNRTCSTFTAAITGQTNLTNPSYCIYTPSNILISCNTTGVFNNLPYGSYCIKVDDSCVDTLITRCFTVTRNVPLLNVPVVSGATCSTFNVNTSGSGLINPQYCLYDSAGNVVACNTTGIFNGIPHGNYCIRAISCGDTTAPRCFSTAPPTPSVNASVSVTDLTCTTFTATVTGQTNLTRPSYCLLNAAGVQIFCNTTGVFTAIPYGSYCIAIQDGCVDTTITRCFTQTRVVPTVNPTMHQTASTCSTFTAQVEGYNLTSPQYCLYDSTETLISCNTSGIFSNIPYGRYCVRVEDACGDTMRVCQTFVRPGGVTINTSRSCTIGSAIIDVIFSSGFSPYTVNIYHPSGASVFNITTSSNPVRAVLPGLPAGYQYKVVATDACGQKDSSYVTPYASVVTKSITAIAKCPSASWSNGSGDLSVSCTSNYYPVLPEIIKKNNVAFYQGYSSVSGTTYSFTDLEPALYVVEYTMQTCNTKLYDTIAITPYSYPTQGQSAIYQCDDNSFSLGADAQGGVSPYTFQIIGSLPATPSIVSAPQASPLFTINNGTIYSLIRLRTVDACGNATLNDISVLPLQNIAITASSLCYFTAVSLSVDTIANATYEWYKKRSATDSILVGTGPVYTIPFFAPEHTAVYVCKITVNAGCLIRLSYYDLRENCGYVYLASGVHLSGKNTEPGSNELSWKSLEDASIEAYELERKEQGAGSFSYVTKFLSRRLGLATSYIFKDKFFSSGNVLYRLKMRYADGRIKYSNTVVIKSTKNYSSVYPNPVTNVFYIQISGAKKADYQVQVVSMAGNIIYVREEKNIADITLRYTPPFTASGMYFIKVENKHTGVIEWHKIMFR